MPDRRHVHSRSIKVDAYARSDGLWDLEAVLTDLKARDFLLATGVRPVGKPVHDLLLTVTINTQFDVVACTAQSRAAPYPGQCEAIEPAYEKFVGLNLLKDFRKEAKVRLGGARGCTHLTELAGVLPTAAVQAFAGEVFRTHESAASSDSEKPWQIDRCHALRSDGPAVAQFYPRWSRP